MNFVNLTPHAIVLRAENGADTTVPPSGTVARVSSTQGGVIGQQGGIPLYGRNTFGEVVDLPAAQPDTIYIVSGIVAGRTTGRDDVFCPGTGPKDNAVRDEAGRIIAVTRLIQAG